MFYALNAKGTVLYRNRDLSRLESQVRLVAKHSGVQLRITDVKPANAPVVSCNGILPYNDSIEQFA